MADGTVNTESLGFRIVVVIVTLLFAVLFIVNSVYFDRIYTNPGKTVTSSQAYTLFWINIVMAVIAVALFLWAVVRLFLSPSTRTQAATTIKQKAIVVKNVVAQKAGQAHLKAKEVLSSNAYVVGGPGEKAIYTKTVTQEHTVPQVHEHIVTKKTVTEHTPLRVQQPVQQPVQRVSTVVVPVGPRGQGQVFVTKNVPVKHVAKNGRVSGQRVPVTTTTTTTKVTGTRLPATPPSPTGRRVVVNPNA